ncbi:hypothetical protein J6590_073531 [Homalodisca vitripennis]|nr:hypothetical protein J6590_073531 [Homalodisca vitripennis]
MLIERKKIAYIRFTVKRRLVPLSKDNGMSQRLRLSWCLSRDYVHWANTANVQYKKSERSRLRARPTTDSPLTRRVTSKGSVDVQKSAVPINWLEMPTKPPPLRHKTI